MGFSGTLGLAGSPGTGKKSVAPLVAGALGAKLIDLNAVALAAPEGSRAVDTRWLRRALHGIDLSSSVVFGHLLPHVLKDGEVALVAVLRCEPLVLKRRLVARGYPHEKIVQNVEAELIGLVLDECVRTFGPMSVREYDTTSATPADTAAAILGGLRPTRPRPWIDWTLRYDSSAKLRSLLSATRTEPAST